MSIEQQLLKETKENGAKLTVLIGLERQTQEALKRIGKQLKKTDDRIQNIDEIITEFELRRIKKIVEPMIRDMAPYPLSH